MHPLLTVVMERRPELLYQVTLHDLATMQLDPQAAVLGTEKSKAAVPFLDLSPLQRQDIAAGNALFARLCGNIQQQHQQLQLQAAATSTAQTSVGSSGTQQPSRQDFLQGHVKQLQQRARETERMEVLLQEEFTLKAAGCAFVMGCLTWEQLVRGYVLAFPYPLRLPVLMDEIAQQQQH